MKKSILSISYAVSLVASTAVQAAGNSPFQVEAEEQARQSLVAARQMIREELEQAMRVPPVASGVLQTALSGAIELPCESAVPAR